MEGGAPFSSSPFPYVIALIVAMALNVNINIEGVIAKGSHRYYKLS